VKGRRYCGYKGWIKRNIGRPGLQTTEFDKQIVRTFLHFQIETLRHSRLATPLSSNAAASLSSGFSICSSTGNLLSTLSIRQRKAPHHLIAPITSRGLFLLCQS
jgi:hypothetical protein